MLVEKFLVQKKRRRRGNFTMLPNFTYLDLLILGSYFKIDYQFTPEIETRVKLSYVQCQTYFNTLKGYPSIIELSSP